MSFGHFSPGNACVASDSLSTREQDWVKGNCIPCLAQNAEWIILGSAHDLVVFMYLVLQRCILSFQRKTAIAPYFFFVLVFIGTGVPTLHHLLLHELFSAT